MPSNKIMLLCVVISLCSHILVISLTGFIHLRQAQRPESVLTVDLQHMTASPEGLQAPEKDLPPPKPVPDRSAVAKGLQEETVDLGSADARYDHYLRRIKRRIDRRWSYPTEAYERREEGQTVIRFTVDPGGSLLDMQVLESSGSERLDQVALAVVREAAPYDPLPSDLNLARLNIVARFLYRID